MPLSLEHKFASRIEVRSATLHDMLTCVESSTVAMFDDDAKCYKKG